MKCKRFFAVLLAYMLIFGLSIPISAAELASVEKGVEEIMGIGEVMADISGSDAVESKAENEKTQPVGEELMLYNAGTDLKSAMPIAWGIRYEDNFTINRYHYYTFSLEQSGRVTINLTCPEYAVDFKLLDNRELFMPSVKTPVRGDNTYLFDLTAGTYYLFITGSLSDYYFTATYESAEESFAETGLGQNNSISSAFSISTGKEYKGQIAKNDDWDYYKFTLHESGKITFNLTTEMKEIHYYIYDSNKNLLTNNRIEMDKDTGILSFNKDMHLVSGDYYVALEQEFTSTGNYTFSVMTISAEESFKESEDSNDNSLAKANNILVNTEYIGHIAHNDEVDYYKLYIAEKGMLTIEVKMEIDGARLEICDSNGKKIWDESLGYNLNVTEEKAFSKTLELSAGNYYIKMSRYRSGDNLCDMGRYWLKTTMHSHTYTDTITKATLKSDGSIVTKCSCGVVKSQKVINHPSTIKLSKETYVYDGKTKKSSVVVKDTYGKVISSANYTVSYAPGRINVGKYKVTVKFKGNYSGTKELSFTIVPKKTGITKLTASSKGFTVKFKKVSNISGYQIQYSTKSNFKGATTKTVSTSKTSQTYNGLKSRKTYYVRVRTYKTVKGKKYYSDWSSEKRVTTKK